MYIYVYIYGGVRLSGIACTWHVMLRPGIYIYVYAYVDIYIYVCVCVCMYMYMERERERERERESVCDILN